MIVQGYKYNTEAAARNAQNSLKNHFFSGRPQGKYVTTEWVSVEYNNGVNGEFWYFLGDYSPVLGNEPQEFEIDREEI